MKRIKRWVKFHAVAVLVISAGAIIVGPVGASHQGHGGHAGEDVHETAGPGLPIAGASFQIFVDKTMAKEEADPAAQTVVKAFTLMMQHRSDYPRFDEAVRKDMLQTVVIEQKVMNREGKEFPFLVARTNDPGRVKLLVNASSLKAQNYLHRPEQLAPVLAKEFQWVVSKADTTPKAKTVSVERDLKRAPIHTDKEIETMPAAERLRLMQRLFETYLTTVDEQKSLANQSFYEVGTTTLVSPAQPDSTVKLYDIRVREALQKIVTEQYFEEHTPRAVKTLLNGKVWHVSFVKIDQRDWATRTRVAPDDQVIAVGERDQQIQPAKILVNLNRTATTDDRYYQDTKGLPMGALSPDQLARVIAWEIQSNIIEKSMTGHVAQDAKTAPK
jgi:hypothetical protein